MNSSKYKYITILLFFSMIIGSENCLIDLTVSFPTEAGHTHDENNENQHHDQNRSNHHDDGEKSTKLCCNDFQNFYFRKGEFKPYSLKFQLSSIIFLPEKVVYTESPGITGNELYSILTLFLPRLQDRYALTCLLHAPPVA